MSSLLEATGLNKIYTNRGKSFQAVQEVSLTLEKGKTLGIVGESGSGKTTLAKMLAGMTPVTSGEILLKNVSLHGTRRSLDERCNIQYMFQDPVSSLNPRMKVAEILREPLKLYFKMDQKAADQRIEQLLQDVGLPVTYKQRYPKELSGGQCQRVGIARALAAEPQIIVCDEPTSALDMTIQAQVLDLLQSLQQSHGISYIVIAHGLEVVYQITDYVLVMKQGEVVEEGPTKQIFHSPKHPYTQSLIQAILQPDIPYFEIN